VLVLDAQIVDVVVQGVERAGGRRGNL